MAVFSIQLVFSMVVASLLSKSTGKVSLARWLLCSGRLARYMHPSEEELRAMAGMASGLAKGRKDKGRKDARLKDSSTFTIPKNTPIELEAAPVRKVEILPLHYYTEFQWLIDFAAASMFVFFLTETYYLLVDAPAEFNLSNVWCLLVIGFALKIMYSLTAMYFRTDDGGERIMVVIFGFFFLVIAMAVIIFENSFLDFGLQPAYRTFSDSASAFLAHQGIYSAGPASLLTMQIFLVLFAAVLGSFLAFPGLRLAKMHSDAIKYTSNPFLQLLLNVNIAAPLMLSLLWVNPVVRDFVVEGGRMKHKYLLTSSQFECVRLLLVQIFCLFRFMLIWPHLQAHLNLAVEKVNDLRKEAGRISLKDLQKLVGRVFYYLCVVSLQYLAPLILLLYCTFLLKSLGGFDITGSFNIEVPQVPLRITETSKNVTITDEDISLQVTQFSLALASLRQVFQPMCFRAILSFFVWWISTAWFITSAFGMVFYSYFSD